MTATEASIKTADFMAADELALAHELRRERRFDEARAYLTEQLPRLAGKVRLDALLLLARVECSAGRPADALRVLGAHRAEFDGADDRLLAWLHQNRACAYQMLGLADEAFIDYEQSIHHFQKAGDTFEEGSAENNLALMLAGVGRFEESRTHLKAARACFRGAPVRLASVDDTEAQICLLEGKRDEALHLSLNACATFEAHGERRLLVEGLRTLQKAAADVVAAG